MITDREKLVLSAIVNYYLTSGETIGSRALVKKYGIDFSSATIRNVMADLEDLGYIAKTHVSSGRIPTDAGYRYYLDELLEIEKLTKMEKERIEVAYEKRIDQLDSMLRETSDLLSKMTSYAGIVIEPNHNKNKIKKIELVHIDDHLVMAVIVMENKAIRTKNIVLEEKLTRKEVIQLSDEINEKISSGEFSKVDLSKMLEETKPLTSKIAEIEDAIEKEIYKDIEGKMFFNNASSIIDTQGIDAQEAMKIFGDDRHVKALFEELVKSKEKNYGAVNVIFGDEINKKGLENYSFVYSIYKVGDSEGIVGVIGPKRMAYSKTIGLVDYVSKEVNKVIKKIDIEEVK